MSKIPKWILPLMILSMIQLLSCMNPVPVVDTDNPALIRSNYEDNETQILQSIALRNFSSSGMMGSLSLETPTGFGIWVRGLGVKSVPSNVGLIKFGIEGREKTVSEARQIVATVMEKVLDRINALGIDDESIVTTRFNIYPQTIWVDVSDSTGKHTIPRIISYVVSNEILVKVRFDKPKDSNKLGAVIDAVVNEGGDLIRVNSISFDIGNPEKHGLEIRELAVKDAEKKAKFYAEATGITLGPMFYLSEIDNSVPITGPKMSRSGIAEMADFSMTSIQGGNLKLTTEVQVGFAIER